MAFRPSLHELAGIRADAAQLLPVQVACYHPTNARTAQGSTTRTYVLEHQGPGRIAPMGAEVEFFAEKLGESTGWMLTITPGRHVHAQDQLRAEGRTFEVIAGDYGATDAWLQRVPCREIP